MIRVFAPAKVNLSLRVGAPRPDGFHPLQSAVTFADVGDWLDAAPSEDLSLEIHGEFAAALSEVGDNIVLRAARALAAEAGQAPRAALRLEKNLPVASGMGGGSSDAAATLRALNALWGLNLEEPDLMRVGRTIGADVPVCVAARPTWMTGIGDSLEGMDVPELCAVLVNPCTPLPTGSVFREFDRMAPVAHLVDAPAPCWRTLHETLEGVRTAGNDLSAPARFLLPEIGEIERQLERDARVSHTAISGSGATVFGLCVTIDAAAACAADIAEANPRWWVRSTTLGAS